MQKKKKEKKQSLYVKKIHSSVSLYWESFVKHRITAVLSSARLRAVLNINSVCVCALSVHGDGCVQCVW